MKKSNNNNESLNAETIQQVGSDFDAALPVIIPNDKPSESSDDKHEAAEKMENGKELTASQELKEKITNFVDAKNVELYCNALFDQISESGKATFLKVTENKTVCPLRDYKGEENVIRTEIVNGKTFSFIAFPKKLTVASIVTIYNGAKKYDFSRETEKRNAVESAKKAKEAKIQALETVISITTDTTVLEILNAQLEELKK